MIYKEMGGWSPESKAEGEERKPQRLGRVKPGASELGTNTNVWF